MKKDNKKSQNTKIGNIDHISSSIFKNKYEKYDGYINNESFNYKINEIYATKEDLTKAYNDLINYINHISNELKKYGFSPSEIKNKIEAKQNTLTIAQIKNYREKITTDLQNTKNHAEYFDEFQKYYKENKKIIEHAGGHLDNRFEKYLDIKNRKKFEYINYSKARKELDALVRVKLQKRKEKLDNIIKQLEKRHLSIFTFTRQKKLSSTSDLSMSDLEEITEFILLVDKINEKLKVTNTNFLELTSKLELNLEQIRLKELKIINTNIEDFIIKENLEREVSKVD